ncbi:MAG: GNAT family N-acetyltransferase [Pseudomonadota bacterium]
MTKQPSGLWIRSAQPADLRALQSIETDAARAFVAVGYDEVATGEPLSRALLARAQEEARLFVAGLPAEEVEPLGFVLCERRGTQGHVVELSVRQAMQGRGLGRALMARAERWALGHRLSRLTLTTFEAVPWNAPFYASLGFVRLDLAVDSDEGLVSNGDGSDEDALLTEALRSERALFGEDRPRVAMAKALPAAPS